MRHWFFLLTLWVLTTQAAYARAKNVILFLGDAGGIPTLNLASIHAYNHPQKLFLQQMPYVGLMDTSAADSWVTDSAAGMSAIVTGQKTNNGVISQSSDAVRGKHDGEILQTILEHAEQRGLSTGVVTNMTITDATPAACYAHANDRGASGAIFAQIFTPRFGDGVDLLIGAGRDSVLAAVARIGLDAQSLARGKRYAFYPSLQEIRPTDRRVIVLSRSGDFDVWEATHQAIRILSQNKRGYFLMVEWDMHTDGSRPSLEHVIALDTTIRRTTQSVNKKTLIVFTADHSFDIRLRGGKRGEPLLLNAKNAGVTTATSPIRADGEHTGEQVLVTAQGPGAERVHGFIVNTDLFHIMMAAYGWEKWGKNRK